MNGRGLREQGLKAAGRIKALTGCDLLSVDVPSLYGSGGAGIPARCACPYFSGTGHRHCCFYPYDTVILAVQTLRRIFRYYRNRKEFSFSESVNALRIDTDRQNTIEALEALADALDAPVRGAECPGRYARYRVPDSPLGKLTARRPAQWSSTSPGKCDHG